MAPRKGNFAFKLCRSHFSSLPFLYSDLSCQHPTHIPEEPGALFFRVRRVLGGMWAASEWPPLGSQRILQPPSCGPQELWGPRGSLKNRTSPSAFLRVQARGEGGRAPQRSPPNLSPSASRLHSPRSTLNVAESSPPAPYRPGEGILRGGFPLQPVSDIPTPTQGCRRRALSAVAECHCSLFLPIRVDTAPKASPTPKLPRLPEGTRPGRRTKFGAHHGGRGALW